MKKIILCFMFVMLLAGCGKNSKENILKQWSKKVDSYDNYLMEGTLKIYRNDIYVTLLDSLNKRINFLNHVIEELDLKKVKTMHGRAEEFAHEMDYREKYDIATSRAVANMSTLSEYLIPYVKVNGMIIAMKGPDIDEEINDAENAIKILGGKILNKEEFELPGTDVGRSIVCIRKTSGTASKYPRKAGTPAKEPLY